MFDGSEGFSVMSEFIEFLTEVFLDFGPISARKMFGGYGIYHEGLMFGLVEQDSLYLKADQTTRAHFEARGLSRFSYGRGDKEVSMSYYLAPDDIYDDREAAVVWATLAYQSALRAKSGK
jgi:DNA transformation protein